MTVEKGYQPKTSTVKVAIEWKKIKLKNSLHIYDGLLIQEVPVAYIETAEHYGFLVRFIDGSMLPTKSRTYYKKRSTAMRNCEKKFGIFSDRLRKLYLADKSIM